MKILRRSHKTKQWLKTVILMGILILLASCSPAVDTSPAQEITCPECEELVCPAPVRYEDLWAASAHADSDAEAFTHWNEDDPQEIPAACAKCHSRPGFIDFLGVDGTESGQVDKPAEIGTTLTCFVCHNEATDDLDSAVFPSGATIRLLGPEARCIQCHQGRASTETVEDAIAEAIALLDLPDDAPPNDPDLPNAEISFVNSHSISAATTFGAEVQGGYQYAGNDYAGRYKRGDDFFSCTRCHDQHSLELKFDTCGECHTIAGSDPKDIRVDTTDFDGDGDLSEGIAYEIEALHTSLLEAIQSYATRVSDVPIVYEVHTFPYFFVDTNGNGTADDEEANFSNAYNAWTPRLLRAAYNYNYLTHDEGAYAHNSDYVLQLLYDSLADLGADVSTIARP